MRTAVLPAMMAVVIGCTICSAQAAESRGYLVRLRTQEFSSKALDALEQEGIHVESTIPQLGVVVTKSMPSRLSVKASQLIDHVEPNYVVHISSLDLRDSKYLWGMNAINPVPAWNITTGSKDVVVAISDTGIWSFHSELSPNIWKNPGEVAKNKVDDDHNGYVDDTWGWNFETNNNNPMDDHYHGTHVAGIIGAVGGNNEGVAGVNWNVSLMAVKFIGKDGSGDDANGIKTIIYAADNGAKVLNASWGGDGYSEELYRAIEYARQKGMIVVCAAGNDSVNTDKSPMYPASFPNDNIISVASIFDSKGTLSGFSNYGIATVDIAAPGERILSTFNPTNSPLRPNYYYELDGTSMAAPHVTGAVALMYAANPTLGWQQAKEIILDTATKSSKLAGKVMTGAILNVGEAVKRAVGRR